MASTQDRGALGNMLFNARTTLGLKQWQVADAAALSEGYISRLESGQVKTMSTEAATKLAQALNLQPVKVQQAAGLLGREDIARLSTRPTFAEFVTGDPNLTGDQKQMLIGLYVMLVRGSGRSSRATSA